MAGNYFRRRMQLPCSEILQKLPAKLIWRATFPGGQIGGNRTLYHAATQDASVRYWH
jgi:hypothetical protein